MNSFHGYHICPPTFFLWRWRSFTTRKLYACIEKFLRFLQLSDRAYVSGARSDNRQEVECHSVEKKGNAEGKIPKNLIHVVEKGQAINKGYLNTGLPQVTKWSKGKIFFKVREFYFESKKIE